MYTLFSDWIFPSIVSLQDKDGMHRKGLALYDDKELV
jgi:hypothetical protein